MTNVLLERRATLPLPPSTGPRPHALTPQVLEDIDQLVEQVKADDEIRALVITGSGEKLRGRRRHRRDEHPD